MSRITELIDYLKSHVGDAYVWGAQGQNLSAMSPEELNTFIDRREENAANEKRVKTFLANANKHPLYAFDCSGLIMYWFQNIKGWSKTDKNAQSLWADCKERGELKASTKLQVGDLLFRRNDSKAYHVGVYIGDNWEIEAKGRDDGVVLHPVNRTYWTHWGRHPYLLVEDEPTPEPAAAKVIKLTSPLMHGDDIKKLQEALNGLGYDCGEADGIAGSKTVAAITEFAKAHVADVTEEIALVMPGSVEVSVSFGGKTYKGKLGG